MTSADTGSQFGDGASDGGEVDVIVVGSGVGGLTAALDLVERGRRVRLITRDRVGAGSTVWAQGGLAAVLGDGAAPDTVEAHVADTLTAAAGLAEPVAVSDILTAAAGAIRRLHDRGARFDQDEQGHWLLAREGGHRANRVIRAGGDATGAEVSRTLVDAARQRRLQVLEGHRATGLLQLDGAVRGVICVRTDGTAVRLRAQAVILATGGCGQLFGRTTNPEPATGDGVALALLAGARVADLEFVQFHPTALWPGVNPGADPDNPTVALITEAVRGEGAVLRTASGEALMAGRHPLADLAPRDIVAAAITEYLQASGEERVWLDARRIPDFKERFPTVYATCQQAGIDPVAELIPVVPAAHYQCGGILTDANGRTDVPGLYAIGEVARTGLHGANRLASNSLVEGLVLGERAAADLHEHLPVGVDPKVSPDGGAGLDAFAATTAPAATGWTRTLAPAPLRPEQLSRLRAELSAHLGMLRRGTDLLALTGWLGQEVAGTLPGLTALAIATAANERAESRGCHRRVDHPDTEPDLARSVSWRLADPKDPLSLRAEALPAPGPTH